ncbi:hypothetical protein VP01_5805g1 [Puccinia sorghi]|uniref:Uncharacterized protein n=1 Tax=Puccinia sorghi TaxID=27349 RepID=A0A0L6UI52_9BASI|nr:hypothetical protein VP01_5805g1 [Puccinia sorghi]
MKPSLTNNDTSSPPSSFQASQNGSKKVNKSQSARIAATDQSVPSTFEGNMSGWPQREGFPRDQPGTVAQPLASTKNINSSHEGEYHGLAMPTSMSDNNYSSRPKAKIDHQASSGSYQENGNSPWEAPFKTATAHLRSSTSRQQTSDTVKSTPLLGSPVKSSTTWPSAYALTGSPSRAVGGSYAGTIPKSQTSQVPSSEDRNYNMSSLTTLDTTHPCQIVISSEKSKAQSTLQVGCHNSSTESYSGKRRSAHNLYYPAALQQKSKHPSNRVYTPHGDLDQDKPLAMNGGKLNSWKDGNKDTPVKSKPAKGTFWTYDGADSRLSSNFSSSISATSKKSSSSRTKISHKIYPTRHRLKCMVTSPRPMLGDDVPVNSNWKFLLVEMLEPLVESLIG